MAKARIGIAKSNNEIYRVQAVLECYDSELKKILNNCLPHLFISARSNELPPEFSQMHGRNNSVWVELTKDNIHETKSGHSIKGLESDSFTFLTRGKEDGNLIFDADLSDQYWKLHRLLEGRYDGIEGIDFDRMEDGHNAEEVYVSDRLNLYIEQKRFGYCAVYYKMFKHLLNELNIGDDESINLHVVSVGTGSKTDAIALRYAIEDLPGKILNSKFVGIDVKAWAGNDFFAHLNLDDEFIPLPDYDAEEEDTEAGEFFINNEIEIFKNEIADSIEEFEDESDEGRNVYLIVFPNMISEIKPAELMGDLLDEIFSVYEGKEAYVLTSVNPSVIDEEQLVVIREKCGDPMIDYPTEEVQGDPYISALGDYMNKTGERIVETISGICREIGDNDEVKKPIVKQKFIRYRVFRI